jgi:hypothetical protein
MIDAFANAATAAWPETIEDVHLILKSLCPAHLPGL